LRLQAEYTQPSELPREILTGIRMNMGDSDEAYELLSAHDFTKAFGTDIVFSGSVTALLMVSPTGYLIELVHHIK
jgi:hypothetical protein